MHELNAEAFQRWLQMHFAASPQAAIHLFAQDNGVVRTNDAGVPLRSAGMEQFYSRLIADAVGARDCCGILYCMYWLRSGQIVPLYIGKAERFGKGGELSANLTSRSFFGRWGYSKYYHLGDLGVALRGRSSKYSRWAARLFNDVGTLRLRSETYFGAALWTHVDRCCCGSQTNVAELEQCLIQHARHYMADDNLNVAGGAATCRCP